MQGSHLRRCAALAVAVCCSTAMSLPSVPPYIIDTSMPHAWLLVHDFDCMQIEANDYGQLVSRLVFWLTNSRRRRL